MPFIGIILHFERGLVNSFCNDFQRFVDFTKIQKMILYKGHKEPVLLFLESLLKGGGKRAEKMLSYLYHVKARRKE